MSPSQPENPPPRPRRRFLLPGLLLLLPLGLPTLWFTSSDFRVVVIEWAYPHLDKERQERAFKRLREVEERPDVAWLCFVAASEDPVKAWETVFREWWSKGPFEYQGMEDAFVAILERPPLAPVRGDLLTVLVFARVKDPRLPPLLKPYLDDPKHRVEAAWSLAINGRSQDALPTLLAVLDQPPRVLKNAWPGNTPDIPSKVGLALIVLRDMGPEARAALPAIRPWAKLEAPHAERLALAALWAIDGDQQARARLKANFRNRKRTNFNVEVNQSFVLAEIGEGDQEVRATMMGHLKSTRGYEVKLLNHLGYLGAVGAPSLPFVERHLDHENAAIRHAAREAKAAIEQDKRGGRP